MIETCSYVTSSFFNLVLYFFPRLNTWERDLRKTLVILSMGYKQGNPSFFLFSILFYQMAILLIQAKFREEWVSVKALKIR